MTHIPRSRAVVGVSVLAILAVLVVPAPAGAAPHAVPRPDHIVVVIDENHAQGEIVGSPDAPYITGLSQQGANFTNSHAIAQASPTTSRCSPATRRASPATAAHVPRSPPLTWVARHSVRT